MSDDFVPPTPLTLTQAQARYGAIVDGEWPRESRFMGKVHVPFDLVPHLTNTATGRRTTGIYINLDLAPALEQALANVVSRGLHESLKSFDGSFNIRTIRGSNVISTHAYGLAIDINAKGNGLGEEPTIDRDLVKCFTDAGWTWGGTFSRRDGMHFQIAAW